MSDKWPNDAENYCIKEMKVGTILHQDEKIRYDLSGLSKNMLIALFEKDGFLIIRIGELENNTSSVIKSHPNYVDRRTFAAILFAGR